jgi:Flp pilus assembly protein TadG
VSADLPRPRLAGDESGATIVEFAFVLPVLCVLLLGIFDLGYKSYASSVMQGALHDAARMATVGNVTMNQIDARVRERLGTFAGPQATITTATESTYDFQSVRRAERLIIDTAPVGSYNNGDCWEEVTGNTQHDANRGRGGQGAADDIVRYEVTMTYPRIVPIHRFLGWSANETITASTVLRNQPYAGRVVNIQRLQYRWEQDPPSSPPAWHLRTC